MPKSIRNCCNFFTILYSWVFSLTFTVTWKGHSNSSLFNCFLRWLSNQQQKNLVAHLKTNHHKNRNTIIFMLQTNTIYLKLHIYIYWFLVSIRILKVVSNSGWVIKSSSYVLLVGFHSSERIGNPTFGPSVRKQVKRLYANSHRSGSLIFPQISCNFFIAATVLSSSPCAILPSWMATSFWTTPSLTYLFIFERKHTLTNIMIFPWLDRFFKTYNSDGFLKACNKAFSSWCWYIPPTR